MFVDEIKKIIEDHESYKTLINYEIIREDEYSYYIKILFNFCLHDGIYGIVFSFNNEDLEYIKLLVDSAYNRVLNAIETVKPKKKKFELDWG